MRAALFYFIFVHLSQINAQMPWEVTSLPEESDEDMSRAEFECLSKCYSIYPSYEKENNNTVSKTKLEIGFSIIKNSNKITKVCERKVTNMRLLRVGNTRMYISKTLKTWYQSYQFCRKFGMNLVPIENAATETALRKLITKHAQVGEGFWTGATNTGSEEKKFYWLYGGFDEIGVKIVIGGDGQCLVLRIQDKSGAKDTDFAKADCTIPKRFICSFSLACIAPFKA